MTFLLGYFKYITFHFQSHSKVTLGRCT